MNVIERTETICDSLLVFAARKDGPLNFVWIITNKIQLRYETRIFYRGRMNTLTAQGTEKLSQYWTLIVAVGNRTRQFKSRKDHIYFAPRPIHFTGFCLD